MTVEDKNDLKEFITMTIQGHNARNYAEHEIINEKLDGIKCKLDDMKKQIDDHDKILRQRQQYIEEYKQDKKNREQTCPKSDDIQHLKDNMLTIKEIKKYNAKLIAYIVGLGGLILTIIELFRKGIL